MNTDPLTIIDAALASATQRSGPHLVCHPGCTQCCHGIFPISHEDAARLNQALETLATQNPTKAQTIQTRITASRQRLSPHFPGNPQTGILHEDYESSDLFTDESESSLGDNEPCPILDPATGTCDLYAARPIVCRTFGPPTRTPDGNLATCELCYIHASTQEIAAAELDPTLPALEAASNQAFNSAHNLHGQTIIAFAFPAKP
jgi:Fe-S-cluster containining protein